MILNIANYKLFVNYIQQKKSACTLIFLHDAWGCTEMWENFPAHLAQIYHANYIVYDRAGHGQSSPVNIERRPVTFFEDEADILIELMDRLQVRNAILVGHSDGGTIALIAAGKYPSRIQGLILESAHTCIEQEGLKLVADITEQSKHTHLLESLQKYHGENIPNVFNYWSRMWSDERFLNWNIIPQIQKITCSTIAYRGENDPFDTVKQNITIAQNTKGKCVLTLIPNAGHTPHKDNEKAVIQFIIENWKN